MDRKRQGRAGTRKAFLASLQPGESSKRQDSHDSNYQRQGREKEGPALRIISCEQNSEEWWAARCGLPTASQFSAVLAKGEGKTRASYLRKVVAERLTGLPVEGFKNAHMDRGHEMEPFGRTEYQKLTGNQVEVTGLIVDDELRAGASPDGLVGLVGGLELKSVLPTTQVETIERGGVPSEHAAQIQGNLWISGREWWDFGSFCLEMPERLQMFVIRVQRDEKYIANLAKEVARFNADADALIKTLESTPMSNLVNA